MLRAQWERVRLGDYCSKIGSGATPKGGAGAYLSEGPYSLIRSQNVLSGEFSTQGLAFISGNQAHELRGVEVLPKDVLLNITGDSVARSCQVDNRVLPARVNQHVAIVRPHANELDPDYLRYWFISPDTQAHLLTLAGGGATRNALTKGMIEALTVPKPPLRVQLSIAALDDKIDLNRRMNQTLEAMAQALFKSWFVDFEPVLAKSEGRPTGLPPDLDAHFSSEFEDSPLGEIPRGWSAGTIHDLAAMVRQQVNPLGTPEKLFAHHSIPAYDAACAPVLEPGSAIKSSKFSVPKGSVLVSKLNPHIPRIWLTDVQDGQTAVASTEFFVLSPRQPVCSAFLYSMMSSPEFALDLQTLVTGTSNSHQRVQPDAFMNYGTVVPSRPVAEAFSLLAKPWLDQVLTNRKESAALRAMRDDLLPRLLSGEVEVAQGGEMAHA